MPRQRKSKYDPYFDIDFDMNKATCRTCQDVIVKNCFGMKQHLLKKHNTILDSNDTQENEPSNRKKTVIEVIEPVEDQICREAAKYGASFR